ncbi:MAG TPA: hypothetical protein VGC92_09695 [Phenylobacterium sp.]
MPQRTVALIERLIIEDVTVRYFIRPGSRSRPWRWFQPDQVPPFEGRTARFEMERVKGGWRFLHQIGD